MATALANDMFLVTNFEDHFRILKTYAPTERNAKWLKDNVDFHNIFTVVNVKFSDPKIVAGFHNTMPKCFIVTLESWTKDLALVEWLW